MEMIAAADRVMRMEPRAAAPADAHFTKVCVRRHVETARGP